MNSGLEILNQKLELIQWLSTIEDISIINKIMDLKKKESIDWAVNLSKNVKESIELGIIDANPGKLKPHSEAKKLYAKWL
jgi:hypothetical protein